MNCRQSRQICTPPKDFSVAEFLRALTANQKHKSTESSYERDLPGEDSHQGWACVPSKSVRCALSQAANIDDRQLRETEGGLVSTTESQTYRVTEKIQRFLCASV